MILFEFGPVKQEQLLGVDAAKLTAQIPASLGAQLAETYLASQLAKL